MESHHLPSRDHTHAAWLRAHHLYEYCTGSHRAHAQRHRDVAQVDGRHACECFLVFLFEER